MAATGDTQQVHVAGRYRLNRRIGSGGMGVVWQATDERLHRTVAVKEIIAAVESRLDPDGRLFDESRDRIQREARIGARLQHPNVISVFDVVVHDDRPWLVMEYLPSQSLGELIAERGPLPPAEVADIGRQVAAGLAAAHAAGIVHRDITPGNVLIAKDGAVKITDFGVSRAAGDVQLTRTGLIAGTPAYLAPEVARGQPPTPASDMFALGATLYSAVEGEPPFGLSDNAFALLHQVANGKVRPPQAAGPLTAQLMQLLRPDPDERPTALAAEDGLSAVAARRPLSSQTPPRVGAEQLTVPTSVVPARDVESRSGPEPTAALPVTPASPVPAPPPRPPTQRRPAAPVGGAAAGPRRLSSRSRRMVVLVVALLVAGSAVVLGITLRNTDTGTSPDGATAAPVASQPPASPPASSAAATGGAVTERAAMVTFIKDYYALLPRGVDQAWSRLGPAAQQQSGGYGGFRKFYDGLSAVQIVGEPRAIDGRTVQATIRFQPGSDDLYEFVLVPGPNGGLIMESFRRPGASGG